MFPTFLLSHVGDVAGVITIAMRHCCASRWTQAVDAAGVKDHGKNYTLKAPHAWRARVGAFKLRRTRRRGDEGPLTAFRDNVQRRRRRETGHLGAPGPLLAGLRVVIELIQHRCLIPTLFNSPRGLSPGSPPLDPGPSRGSMPEPIAKRVCLAVTCARFFPPRAR
ncbi:hypothetical protein MRX96_026609 [Rhipicephalus microplus]